MTINPLTGASTGVGAGFAVGTASTNADYGFDFNPTADVIRVINNGDLNLRVSPNTGAVVGTDPALNPG